MENEAQQKIPMDGLQMPEGFKLFNDGLYRDLGEGDLTLASAFPFYVDARVRRRERGEYFYRIVVSGDCESLTLYAPAEKGPLGIVRSVKRTGTFIRNRLALDYVDEFLALNFMSLPLIDSEDCQEEIFDVEAGSVYELFLEYLAAYEEEFMDMKLGKYLECGATVAVKQTSMNSFFKQASVSNIQVVLKYWKQQGLLQTESDGKHLSRRIRINGVDQRVYVVKVSKENDQNESSKTRGIRVGDTVSLIVAGTDERMILTLVVDGEVNRFASDIEGRKQVSTKSQLGAALIGKNTGDSVTVKSSSGITLYRILKVYHGTVRRFLYKTDMAKKQHAGAM